MIAYRAWCTFFDGVSTFASPAYEKKERAEAVARERNATCIQRVADGRLVMTHDVRSEELPRVHTPTTGPAWTIDTVIMGDDTEWTKIE